MCRAHMPVCYLKKEEFCGGPLIPDPSIWQPAFTLQANFLGSGGLFLCFSFHHSVMDEWSVGLFLEKLAWGIHSPEVFTREVVYGGPSAAQFSQYVVPGAAATMFDFPEWSISDIIVNGVPEYEDKPTNYIFIMSAARALQWSVKIIHCLRGNLIPDAVKIIDCLVGMIWVEIIRAGQISAHAPNRDVRLYIDINTRTQLQPSLGDTYFGNMSANSVGYIRNGDEIMETEGEDDYFHEQSIRWFAQATRVVFAAKEKLDNVYIRRRITTLANLTKPVEIQKFAEDAITCSKSSTKMCDVGYGADLPFGIPGAGCGGNDGRPRFIRRPWINDSRGVISVVPRQSGNEAN
ncbi:uncharacterized protein GGS22DRAFT_106413 [Annulohypoxylon maeteangense]|uniref:uncharacterized protein n=1 Tax=Annulohypoxylon maeteangense TaxID=1927788 RepID=UPI002007DCEC|nr:uncharacterized protein GGS22DRAFT_106413 [Annulohypoxylon maeteangense]KAI0887231.1 hypothetical protein GGS22DRAFT_106413 [Annulohypoxylon maeteangense]